MSKSTVTPTAVPVLSLDDDTTRLLVNQIKEEMKGGRKYVAFITEHNVTRANYTDFAKSLAILVTPEGPQNEAPVQKTDDGNPVFKDGKPVMVKGPRTRYGNALNTAKAGLSRNLPDDGTDDVETKEIVLRASLSGEGGGNVTIPNDHPLYGAIVALIRAGK